ncbi:S1 family peptidase [Actinokineospora bangkokensis]|uniref:Serine protease n=1 Tax=Actinokineospora bangkokensis TaxID=1193682 RepID=A0A1Q9LBP0_9PSEU|nr:S1 family peptidase [Actinokineospora bangkokensis]OLR89433.1 serine protease [Actinokineospora bangkokensis]
MRRSPLRSLFTLAGAAATAVALAAPAQAALPPLLTAGSGTGAVAATQQALQSRLGGSYSGSWLDSTTGALTVGVTDASRLAEVRAAGATPKLVARSAAELAGLQSTLDRKAATAPGAVPAGVTGWYVDVTTNELVVSVVRGDAAALAWAKSAGTGGTRVESVTDAPRPLWDIIGGQAINFSAGRCSVGFNARSSSGTRYVITAGHCTELGGSVRGTGGTIGSVSGSSFPTNDYGRITVSSTSAVSTPLVDRYSSGSDVTVAGSSVTAIGGGVCRSGSTTGWRCGTVQAYNQTVNYGGGDIVYGLTRTNACAEPGDSGGSFVSNPGTGTRVQAQGLTSGGSGNCSSGGTTYFQPINEALSAYGLTLVTG